MTIEEEEQLIFYLEKVDNKFCQIKNVLRDIKNKIKGHSKINSEIIKNVLPMVKFFDADACDPSPKEAAFSDSTLFDNLEKDLPNNERSDLPNNMGANHSLLNDSDSEVIQNYSEQPNISIQNVLTSEPLILQNLTNSENTHNISNITDDYGAFVPLDIKTIPPTLANESVLLEIYECIKGRKSINLKELQKKFHSTPQKKIEIIVNFLTNRKHVVRKENNLIYKGKLGE